MTCTGFHDLLLRNHKISATEHRANKLLGACNHFILDARGRQIMCMLSCPEFLCAHVWPSGPMVVESCIVYERGEAPVLDTVLDESVGWAVVIGFGLFFTCFSVGLTKIEERVLGTTMSSEMFNTTGRSIGASLTATVIVSQWTWAATLLMSSNMGWRVGVSGPFWYASGAAI